MSKRDCSEKQGLTLAKTLDICHATEASKFQLKVMVIENQQSHDVNFLRKKQVSEQRKVLQTGNKPPEGSTVAHKQHTQFHQGINCGYCGSQHQPGMQVSGIWRIIFET